MLLNRLVPDSKHSTLSGGTQATIHFKSKSAPVQCTYAHPVHCSLQTNLVKEQQSEQ